MSTLQQLQASCLGLLFSTQAHPVGFARLEIKDGLVPPLNEKEDQLLALYDKLGELYFEKRVLEAELDGTRIENDDDDDDDQEKIQRLEKEMLEARARYQLKEKIVETTLATHPILKAVHSGARSSLKERALLPLIIRRDLLSLTHSNLSNLLSATITATTTAQVAYAESISLNRQLTSRLIDLTERQKKDRNRKGRENNPRFVEIEEELKEAKVRWEVMRNVLQAVVVGSGIDWARDDKLREVVLGCGDDEN